MKDKISGRTPWLGGALAAALACAALRRWQLSSAFDPELGLPVPGAQASVILLCVLLMAAAWFLLLAAGRPLHPGQGGCWGLVFLDTGDRLYPIGVVTAAFLAAAAAPVLLPVGLGQWQAYQAAVAARLSQLPSNNGMLTIVTAAGAALSFLGLVLTGRDGLRPGRRGRVGLYAALPGVAGCVWLMESFRAHAANPVRWDYAPLLLAIVCGMLFYMDFAGISAGTPHPRRLLWMAAMTLVLSAPAAVSALADRSLGDMLLLASQSVMAAAVLWRLVPYLDAPPRPDSSLNPREPGEASIQEESTYE